jgi:hypothetical protein
VMTPKIIFCFEDQDVSEAARLMEENQVRRLVVLNERKRLVGIVSGKRYWFADSMSPRGLPKGLASTIARLDSSADLRMTEVYHTEERPTHGVASLLRLPFPSTKYGRASRKRLPSLPSGKENSHAVSARRAARVDLGTTGRAA